MNISYVSTYNASDIEHWSGLGHCIGKSLENQDGSIEYINIKAQMPLTLRLKNIYYNKIRRRSYDFNRSPIVAREFAKQVKSMIKRDTNVILSPSSIPISLLDTKKPKVFYTDATFAGLVGFYDDYSNLCSETIKNGNYLEQQALASCSLAIYASDWAAKTAIENYTVNPEKIKVVPFGANISGGRNLKEIKSIVSKRSHKECSLLFIGKDWERKGGEMAIKVAEQLNKNGLQTKLYIVGIKAIPIKDLPSFVTDYGYISKRTAEGRALIDSLIAQSHFFILPTKAEAYGIVFCEANSFGLPCLTTNVGGIPTIIKDNLNGKKFSLSASANDYASYIESVFSDYNRYHQLAFTSFAEYENRLNWNVAGKKIISLLKTL